MERTEEPGTFMDYPLPCSYRDYCWEYEKKSPRKQLPVTA